MTPDFVHIHNHTQYSKFDGLSSICDIERDGEKIPGLVSTAKAMGMKAVGMTDHGTFAGAIVFLKECRRQDIKPILGMEAYQARNHKCKSKNDTVMHRPDGTSYDVPGQQDGRKGNRHINIIAKNHKGFQNVSTLSHRASLDGYYYDPRLDFGLLAELSEGVICTSACLSNVINWNLSIDEYDKAKKAATLFKDIYGEDFYLEMMYHGLESEGRILSDIQKLAKELDIKIIATNDCHYVRKQDAEFHEVLMCMSSGRLIKDPKRLKFPYEEFYFKSKEEMAKIFGHIPSVLSNTVELAEKCDYSDIVLGEQMLLPRFDLPDGYSDPYEYLSVLAWQGLKKIGFDNSTRHHERLKLELDDIKLIWDTKRYDFSTYFLIVEDIMRFAKENKIAAGIRGSGFGSLLLKCLGITEGVDPLEQDLLWERFLGFDSKKFISEDDLGIKPEVYTE
jgi:DNA polymerase-3 subunit alpha